MFEIRIKSPANVKIFFTPYIHNYFEVQNSKNEIIYFRYLKNDIREISFNLTEAGTYFLNIPYLSIQTKPIEIKNPVKKLPSPERPYKAERCKTQYNPDILSPARIDIKRNLIEYNDKFLSMPKYLQEFILLHEKGHFYYTTEWKADLYAMFHFINSGQNISQGIYALTEILRETPENLKRIQKIFKTVTNGN